MTTCSCITYTGNPCKRKAVVDGKCTNHSRSGCPSMENLLPSAQKRAIEWKAKIERQQEVYQIMQEREAEDHRIDFQEIRLKEDLRSRFFKACADGNLEALSIILDHYIDRYNLIESLDINNRSGLRIAIEKNRPETVEFLLQHDADTEGLLQETYLQYACSLDLPEIAYLLLQYGADPYASSPSYGTPFQESKLGLRNKCYYVLYNYILSHENFYDGCAEGNYDIVEAFILYGININAMDIGGLAGLHIACRFGHANIVRLLLERNADINNQMNANRDTPLHIACKFSRPEIVKILLDHGADYSIRNSDDKFCVYYTVDCIECRNIIFRHLGMPVVAVPMVVEPDDFEPFGGFRLP
jgi:ankyrin repeat protein